jgi:hypothetical protein
MSKTTIEVEFSAAVKAVLREDELTLSLTVAVGYGNRSVSVSHEEFSAELQAKVKAVLSEVKEVAMQSTLSRAMAAAQHASNVAASRNESVFAADPIRTPAPASERIR